MTGAKAWRQKGTGRARVGALSAGQRIGGGITFGPRPRSYTMKVNRKARRRALRAALSQHAELRLAGRARRCLLRRSVHQAGLRGAGRLRRRRQGARGAPDGEDVCAKSFRNIPGAKVLQADQVGVADVLGASRLIVSEAALERLTRLAS